MAQRWFRSARVTPVLAAGALVAGSLAGVVGAAQAAATASEPVPVQVPAPTGQTLSLMTDPAISADGRYVAFAGREGTDSGLYLYDRTAAETTRLETRAGTEPLTGEFREVSVSADASRIVFTTGEFDNDDLIEPSAKVWLHDRTTGVTSLVSAKSDGTPGNAQSQEPAISGDGSTVAFTTLATDLAPGTGGAGSDVVLRDVESGEIERVSGPTDTNDLEMSRAWGAAVSADGSQVAFVSTQAGMVENDLWTDADAFVRDRSTGKLSHVSLTPRGSSGGDVGQVSLSADGHRVAFDWVVQKVKWWEIWEVVVHDRRTQESVVGNLETGEIDYSSMAPSLSADGRFLTFTSSDVFVRDLHFGTTRSLSTGADLGTGATAGPAVISADGQHAVFRSEPTREAGSSARPSSLWLSDLGAPPTSSATPLQYNGSPHIGISRAKIAGPSHQIKVISPGGWEQVLGRQLTYQWLRNGTPIEGATGDTYSVRKVDFGAGLAVRETASAPGLAPASVRSELIWEEKSSTNVRITTLPSSAKSSRAVRLRLRVSHDLANRPQGTLKVVWGERVRTVKVDRDGLMRVTLRGLAPGRHTVKVRHIGTAFVKSGGVVEFPVRVRR